MIQALNLALKQEMAKDDSVIVLGEDVGVDGGVFRVTEGLLKAFGEERVLDTPLAESGIVGFSIGLALYGLKPVCEIQFSGFSYLAMQQFEALEHHSESREAYYAHTPGLKMVLPSGPRTARALLVSAMRDPDPVIFFEPKLIYRAFREDVPEEEETLPIGKSRLVREGRDLTMIAYGAMLRRTVEAAEQLAREDGVEPEVIDLLTISPLDDEQFTASARKTGRVVIVHEACRSFGPGAEIVARLVEKAFFYLEAPIQRVTGFDVIFPYFAREQAYLPDVARILHGARAVLTA